MLSFYPESLLNKAEIDETEFRRIVVRPQNFFTVSILQRQSVIHSPQKLDALLVVGVTLLCTAAPLIPTNAAITAARSHAATESKQTAASKDPHRIHVAVPRSHGTMRTTTA